MNHLYAYTHLWQILLLHTSYSCWSTGLACEVTRSQLLDNFFLGGRVREGYGLLEEIAGNCHITVSLCCAYLFMIRIVKFLLTVAHVKMPVAM
jgi:hypothetical protein